MLGQRRFAFLRVLEGLGVLEVSEKMPLHDNLVS